MHHASYPVMSFACDHDDLNRAFRIALGDLFSSTILHKSGLMENPCPMIMAGLDYDDPWTRDAAINCWNAGSLLAPSIARNTLIGVLEKSGSAVTIGGQYWDKIIWVTGAWHHYLVTGDRGFLSLAADAGQEALHELERNEFDREINLFRGGACFQDGVSGYPDRYVEGHRSSGPITRWAETNPKARASAGVGLPMMAGSTNGLYYSAYRCLFHMLTEQGRPGADECNRKAKRLRRAILEKLWNPGLARLAYMIDPWETSDRQEGLGLSFALLFGILEEEDAARAIAAQYLTPHGIPCVWPTFRRYETPDGTGVGRHGGTVWPHVQGFWGEAAARHNRADLLLRELVALASHATRDAQFTEIYHPSDGAIEGGRQEEAEEINSPPGLTPYPLPLGKRSPEGGQIVAWRSCRRQTWSATAFLRMIFAGLLGMRFDADGVSFEPVMETPLTKIRLEGLPYRKAILQVEITGSGRKIKSFHLNGKPAPRARIEATMEGMQEVRLVLTDE